MSDAEINVLIAKTCGFTKDVEMFDYAGESGTVDCWRLYNNEGELIKNGLPDYCSDLNAMHEAQKTLGYEQQIVFIDSLMSQITGEPNYNIEDDFCSDEGWTLANATARQRAEAFLRTIEKWKDA